jgi:LmbE family N-acetylglucosaminyl deacetylase
VSVTWDTALLRIDVRSTFWGRWLTPSIEVLMNGKRIAAQYLEPGSAGTRYLNVSALAAISPETRAEIRLVGHHVAWEQQPAELLLFDNAVRPKARVVVVAPHPDDAEIAAFGLYSQSDSRIITVTAGDAGSDTYDHVIRNDAEHYTVKGRLRVWDSLAVPLLGGVDQMYAVNLGYFDGRLKQMFDRPADEVRAQHIDTADIGIFRRYNVAPHLRAETPRSTWNSLTEDLRKAFVEAKPDVIVAPHPFLDVHVDHAYAGIAVLEAVAAARLDGVKLYLYTNHVPVPEYYPEGPTDSVVGPPAWFDAKTRFASVRSVPLTLETQRMKLFALEAMHDARPGPPGLEADLKADARAVIGAVREFVTRRFIRNVSYYRRAPRPNELFFVYDATEACELRRAFLLSVSSNRAGACAGHLP